MRLRKAAVGTIEVTAGASDDLAGLAVDGNMRYREATVQRAHPGGAAGTYPVFAVMKEDDIRSSPLPYSDFTDYTFDLRIEPVGGTPAIVPGTVDGFRKIGEVVWDGAAITDVRFVAGGYHDMTQPVRATAREASDVPVLARGFAAQTADLMRAEDSAATALFRVTPAGQAVLPTQGATGGLLIGGDANLYRVGAAVLASDGQFLVRQAASASPTFSTRLSADTNNRWFTQAGGTMLWGDGTAAPDTNLYRYAANTLATDDNFQMRGGGNLSIFAGETFPRLTLGANGTLSWGMGTAAEDTTLYRSAADTLKTDDALWVARKGTVPTLRVGDDLAFGVIPANQAAITVGSSNASSSVLVGQDASNFLELTWSYNATPASALGILTTSGGAGLRIGSASSKLAFFDGAPVVQYASPAQARIGAAPAALTSSSVLADVIAWVSRLANAEQGYRLLSTSGAWSS
ncbi:MAG: hypothetical protein LC798_13220 [Chloroflexi bacterium]|nr:hypothetical protein [Chloroflexota bacterium]